MPTNMIALDGHGSPAEHDHRTLWGDKMSTQFVCLQVARFHDLMLAHINIDFEKAFGDGPTPAWIWLQSLVMQEVFEHPPHPYLQ